MTYPLNNLGFKCCSTVFALNMEISYSAESPPVKIAMFFILYFLKQTNKIFIVYQTPLHS